VVHQWCTESHPALVALLCQWAGTANAVASIGMIGLFPSGRPERWHVPKLNWENAMTATHRTLARPASLSNAATAIIAVLGLIDVTLTGVIGSPDAPPLIVSLGVAVLGLITLISLVPARRGSRGALVAVVATRVISALLAVPRSS